MKLNRGASGNGSPAWDQELVVSYPALNIRFGVDLLIVGLLAAVPCMLATVCPWLLIVCVNQLLVLAGWGWEDFFVDPSASWLPVAGVGLVMLLGTLISGWVLVRCAVHFMRKVRRSWWLRLSARGFEVNDRVFKARRYGWHEIDTFMLVSPVGQVADAVVAPGKTAAEVVKDGGTQYPVFRVGFHCSPGQRRALSSKLASGFHSRDGTKADGLVMGYWDRPFDEAVDLMNEWLARYRSAAIATAGNPRRHGPV